MGIYTRRQELNILKARLEADRQTFLPLWRDLGDYILPDRPQFLSTDVNKGDRRNTKIFDITGTLAARTCEAGMTSGITSPARPWFKLTTPDPDLAEYGAVKDWLSTVTNRMSTVFLNSNFYQVTPGLYGDTATFGTGAVLVEEDFDQVVRYTSLPIGSYSIGVDRRGVVNLFTRSFQMSIRDLVKTYGRMDKKGQPDWSIFSQQVRNAWDCSNYETRVEVGHAIWPNPDYDKRRPEGQFKRFASYQWEVSSPDDKDVFLKKSGYDNFPVLANRWRVRGQNAWGTESPGMIALPDIKQLQHGEKKSLKAIDKMVDPPLKGPTSLRSSRVSILPGDVTYIDERDNKGLSPVHEVRFDVAQLEMKQEKVRNRVDKAYFADLFLMIAQMDGQMTATEVIERKEEKLVALGPVLQQANQDFLNPNIDLTFAFMLRQSDPRTGKGLIPPPPQELHGVALKVEYTSIMAQAQKAAGLSGFERFTTYITNFATNSQDPSVMDKVNKDKMVEHYGELTSVEAGIIRSDEEVQSIRGERAKAQQAQQQSEMLRQGAGAAKDLSQADLSGNNALAQLVQTSQAGALA